MKKYLIVDSQNLFMRTFLTQKNMDSGTKVGMALHTAFNSLKKAWDKFTPTHIVMCAEGRSWRKDFDDSYKRNRAVARAQQTPREREEMEDLFTMINEFLSFIKTQTNCTFLQHSELEADDLIGGWIQTHPADMHYILSTDTDFHQLLDFNVQQYNATQGFLYTVNGVFDDKGSPAQKKKGSSMIPVETPDPEFLLFEKCIRGDKSDNVFPAYPGARMKSSKKAVGIQEAYNDRVKQGYAWNSFMNTKVLDPSDLINGTETTVKALFNKNKILIDLTQQPQYVKDKIQECISESKKDPVSLIGVNFLRFTEMYQLKSIQSFPDKYITMLTAKDE